MPSVTKCGVCNRAICLVAELLKCHKCLKSFHLECVNVNLFEYDELKRVNLLQQWCCSCCDLHVAEKSGSFTGKLRALFKGSRSNSFASNTSCNTTSRESSIDVFHSPPAKPVSVVLSARSLVETPCNSKTTVPSLRNLATLSVSNLLRIWSNEKYQAIRTIGRLQDDLQSLQSENESLKSLCKGYSEELARQTRPKSLQSDFMPNVPSQSSMSNSLERFIDEKFQTLENKLIHLVNDRAKLQLSSVSDRVPAPYVHDRAEIFSNNKKIKRKRRKHKKNHKKTQNSKDIGNSVHVPLMSPNLVPIPLQSHPPTSPVNLPVLDQPTHESATMQPQIQTQPSSESRKNKLIVVGDSQCRELAFPLNEVLEKDYDICVFSKSGAKFNTVTTDLEDIVTKNNLGDNDFLVILGGSNDVIDGELPENCFRLGAIKKLSKLTNIIVSEVPKRFDLPPRFNKLVKNFNIYLNNCLRQSAVHVINLNNFNRRHFSARGLHYSDSGKVRLCDEIRDLIFQISVFRV